MKKSFILFFGLIILNSCSILNIIPSKKIHKISFENGENKESCDFIFSDTTNNE